MQESVEQLDEKGRWFVSEIWFWVQLARKSCCFIIITCTAAFSDFFFSGGWIQSRRIWEEGNVSIAMTVKKCTILREILVWQWLLLWDRLPSCFKLCIQLHFLHFCFIIPFFSAHIDCYWSGCRHGSSGVVQMLCAQKRTECTEKKTTHIRFNTF